MVNPQAFIGYRSSVMPATCCLQRDSLAKVLSKSSKMTLDEDVLISVPSTPKSKKTSVGSLLRTYSLVPKMSLQRKLEYFYLSYNPGMGPTKHMSFGDAENDVQRDSTTNWKSIADLLLKQDLAMFRMACKQINNKLYTQLSNFAKMYQTEGMPCFLTVLPTASRECVSWFILVAPHISKPF